MADSDLNETELAILFEEAKLTLPVDVPTGLTEQVLADAAQIGAAYAVQDTPPKAKNLTGFRRLFAPIGGLSGALALAVFAGFGLMAGLGDPERLYSLPVMEDILAVFLVEISNPTPLDTLEYLMAES